MSAQNFLLRVRNEMHFHADETCDALSRAEQLRLAEFFKYQGRQGMLPVEQFMRDYFHHTAHVWQMAHRLSELMQPASRVSRVLEPMLGRKTEDDYQIGRHEVSATPRATARLAQHREEVLKLVDLARREGKRISQDTWHFVYRTAPQYSSEPKPAVVERFLEDSGRTRCGWAKLLRRLHELGVLEKIIPEFSHARSLLQFNQYHKYTVDEHCIRAVEEATHFAERQDAVGDVYRQLEDKTTLHLALLLHDLGKGFEEDHSEVGRRIAQETARAVRAAGRTGGDAGVPGASASVDVAPGAEVRHDRSRSWSAGSSDEVGTQERLDMLFLVTCADLAAVGPDVLNSWKVEVLSELYFARVAAVGGSGRRGRRRRAGCGATRRCGIALTPAEQDDPWFERQLAALPESFVTKRPAAALVDTLRRLRQLAAAGRRRLGQLPAGDRHGRVCRRDRSGRRPGDFLQHGRRADQQQHANPGGRDQHAGRRPVAVALCGVASRNRRASRRPSGWPRSADAWWRRSTPTSRRRSRKFWAASRRKPPPR